MLFQPFKIIYILKYEIAHFTLFCIAYQNKCVSWRSADWFRNARHTFIYTYMSNFFFYLNFCRVESWILLKVLYIYCFFLKQFLWINFQPFRFISSRQRPRISSFFTFFFLIFKEPYLVSGLTNFNFETNCHQILFFFMY